MKMSCGKERLWIKVIIVIFFMAITIGVILHVLLENSDNDIVEYGAEYPVYISNLFAAKDTLWLLRARSSYDLPREYDLYRLDENGQQIFVQPYPGGSSVWDRENEKLYDLSDGELHEFDPETGEIQTHSLRQPYEKLCAAAGETVFLQQEPDGPITMYSIADRIESVLDTSGELLLADSGYLLLWDSKTHQLACHDYSSDTEVWEMDLPEEFSSSPVLCMSGENLYVANEAGGNIYVINQFAKNCKLMKTELFARVIGMVSAGDSIICAKRGSDFIRFSALLSDGAVIDLPTWSGAKYTPNSRLLMAVYQGTFYCALQTEDELFSFDLTDD